VRFCARRGALAGVEQVATSLWSARRDLVGLLGRLLDGAEGLDHEHRVVRHDGAARLAHEVRVRHLLLVAHVHDVVDDVAAYSSTE
jgi:hypothetical protein